MRVIRILVPVALLAAGCAQNRYFADRGRDAADVLTFTVGYGGGGKARIGPVQIALLGMVTETGLQAGDWLPLSELSFSVPDMPANMEMCMLFSGVEGVIGGRTALLRGKAYGAAAMGIFSWPEHWGEQTFSFGDEIEGLAERGYRFNRAPYFTQIEVAAALLPAVRIGLNVGEMLDFVLGWAGVDIYADDLGRGYEAMLMHDIKGPKSESLNDALHYRP